MSKYDGISKDDLVEAVRACGSKKKAARTMGIAWSTFRDLWKRRVDTEQLDRYGKNDIHKVGIISDLHYGSLWQQPKNLSRFIDYAVEEGCEEFLVPGDVSDGLRMRADHEFEIFLHSADDIVDYIVETLPETGVPYKFICLSDDTEVYTKELGWVKYSSLQVGQTIMSNVKNNIVYNKVIGVQVLPYTGNMIHIKNNQIDMLVTPDHAVLCDIDGDHEYINASDISKKVVVPCAGFINRPDYNISDGMIALIGLTVTDGTYLKSGGIYIYQHTNDCDPIREVLNQADIKYTESFGHNENEVRFYIGAEISRDVKSYLPSKLDISILIEILSYRQLKLLHKWMIFGDGSKSISGSGMFRTSNPTLADQFQILCTLCGYGAGRHDRIHKMIPLNGHIYTNKLEVNISYRVKKDVVCKQILNQQYDGIVFDITTECGNFLARRNGKAFFTGNCGNHCRSLYKNCGLDLGFALAKERADLDYLGYSKADHLIPGNVKVRLYHGSGNCGVNRSMRLQKKALSALEEYTMNKQEPCSIFISGHCHHSLVLHNFYNMMAISCGSFQATTPYMVDKGLTADISGLILEYRSDGIGLISNPKVECVRFDPIKDDYP